MGQLCRRSSQLPQHTFCSSLFEGYSNTFISYLHKTLSVADEAYFEFMQLTKSKIPNLFIHQESVFMEAGNADECCQDSRALSYKVRLGRLGLCSSERKRLRRDLIDCNQ